MADVEMKGLNEQVIVDDDVADFIRNWEWYGEWTESDGRHKSGYSAFTWIHGRKVYMDMLCMWIALISGATLWPDGRLKMTAYKKLPDDELRSKLVAALSCRSMRDELARAADAARTADSTPIANRDPCRHRALCHRPQATFLRRSRKAAIPKEKK